ncbi:MAG: hypothetical protein DME78_06480 [Verrucomicrobia bacterium]|nr:MAG: hypothetical protein DME78_06480 [Verrucomicrobiota bacterium]
MIVPPAMMTANFISTLPRTRCSRDATRDLPTMWARSVPTTKFIGRPVINSPGPARKLPPTPKLAVPIGWLGAGAILKRGEKVHGIATAATIWSTAAMGAAVACHNYELGAILSAVTFVTLRWFPPPRSAGVETAGRSKQTG